MTLYELLDRFVPKTIKRSRQYPPWFSYEIIRNIKLKHRAWKEYKNQRDAVSLVQFRQLRANTKTLIRIAYGNYCKATEDDISSNPNKFWQFVNTKRKSSSLPTCMCYDNTVIRDPKIIANTFAEFFQSSCTTPDRQLCKNNDTNSLNNFDINHFTEAEVCKSLKKLKSKFTAGLDKIPAFLVKDCATVLAVPLCILFNLIISTSSFPDLWKVSKIVPVFKKGDRSNIENYRPITIVNNFAKAFEMLLHEYVYRYMHNRLSQYQHGFIKGRSTVTNLFCVTQFLADSIDAELQTDVIYTDFSKAFDRLDHNILSMKLQSHGFSENFLKLLKSYLTDRKQYVECSGHQSVEILATSGVPQGSNLGPLLFDIFIDDIVCNINVKCLLYADDMKIYCNIRNINDCINLQGDLLKINEWCTLNKLPLNITKCNVMSFTNKLQPIIFQYSVNGSVLSRPKTLRDLGVTYDQKLSFVDHISVITSDCFRALGFLIRNAKDFSNISTLQLLFSTFIRPRIEYASIIWCPAYNNHIDNLEKVQRKFLKYCYYKENGIYPPVGFPQSDILNRFSLDSLQERRIKSQIIFLHKLINNVVDCPQLLSMLNFHVPRLSAREHLTFHLETPRTNIKKFSPLHQMCTAYNEKLNCVDIFHCSVAMIKKL